MTITQAISHREPLHADKYCDFSVTTPAEYDESSTTLLEVRHLR
jgi:hypothetical protein